MNRNRFIAIVAVLMLALASIGNLHAARGSGGGHSGGGHSGGAHSGGHAGGHSGGFRNHGRIGVFVGAPLYAFGYPYALSGYYGPYGYFDTYPPVLPETSQIPSYVEMPGPSDAPQQAPAYWYYCSEPAGYYPYVQHCPGGWQQVAPSPAPGRY